MTIARARRTDPDTSQAAVQAELTGLATDHRALCLELVVRFPGSTSAELSRLSNGALNRHQTARRLPELAESGDIMDPRDKALDEGITRKVCTVTGSKSLRWWPKHKGSKS